MLCYWFTSKCSHSHSHAINQCTFTFTLNVTPVGQPVCFVRLSCVLGACVPRVPWTVGGGGGGQQLEVHIWCNWCTFGANFSPSSRRRAKGPWAFDVRGPSPRKTLPAKNGVWLLGGSGGGGLPIMPSVWGFFVPAKG